LCSSRNLITTEWKKSETLQGTCDNIMIDLNSVSQRIALLSEYALLSGKKTESTHCRDSKFGQVFIQT
jgi:hypothetical protein